jgi:hypothetical protein
MICCNTRPKGFDGVLDVRQHTVNKVVTDSERTGVEWRIGVGHQIISRTRGSEELMPPEWRMVAVTLAPATRLLQIVNLHIRLHLLQLLCTQYSCTSLTHTILISRMRCSSLTLASHLLLVKHRILFGKLEHKQHKYTQSLMCSIIRVNPDV